MEYQISIRPDKDGYTGRECPTCEKYFKIKNGTGLPEATDCHCPYCNHLGPQNEYWTKQQLEYAKSVVINKVSNDLIAQMKKMERKPDPHAFLSIGISVKGSPAPIAYYSETDLEQRVTCANCSLDYSIFGNFGYCPDCGVHNSLQILNANFDLIKKMLELAESAEEIISEKIIENCLEDAVSSFDGFGREYCSKDDNTISFQSIKAAKDKLNAFYGFDISSELDSPAWEFVNAQFQKRHLLAHKMGVIDEEYIRKTGISQGMLGRKIKIEKHDVDKLIEHLKIMANYIYVNIEET